MNDKAKTDTTTDTDLTPAQLEAAIGRLHDVLKVAAPNETRTGELMKSFAAGTISPAERAELSLLVAPKAGPVREALAKALSPVDALSKSFAGDSDKLEKSFAALHGGVTESLGIVGSALDKSIAQQNETTVALCKSLIEFGAAEKSNSTAIAEMKKSIDAMLSLPAHPARSTPAALAAERNFAGNGVAQPGAGQRNRQEDITYLGAMIAAGENVPGHDLMKSQFKLGSGGELEAPVAVAIDRFRKVRS